MDLLVRVTKPALVVPVFVEQVKHNVAVNVLIPLLMGTIVARVDLLVPHYRHVSQECVQMATVVQQVFHTVLR